MAARGQWAAILGQAVKSFWWEWPPISDFGAGGTMWYLCQTLRPLFHARSARAWGA